MASLTRLPLPSGATRLPGFADAPAAWYYLGPRSELRAGPRRYVLPGQTPYVAFMGESGTVGVLSSRCAHMGADLANGCVRADHLACPLHGWEFAANGACERIPAEERSPIPAFARQNSFPVAHVGDHVFFFNEAQARFPLPFFEGQSPETLYPAAPFDIDDDVPWYFIAANGFDLQHFRNAHDRVLLAEPVVDQPHPYARRITVQLGVEGRSVADRLTRLFAGPALTMSVTSWVGTLVFVTARFRRATSYGMMTVQPLEDHAMHGRVVVWVRRGSSPFARLGANFANAALRRLFIRKFLQSDRGRMTGARYMPSRLIESDRPFADYMEWLQQIHR